jgi:hypothetical protein
MSHKKHYPKTYQSNDVSKSITKPFATSEQRRYHKGYQNKMVSASRKTETRSKNKTVIVTESVNVVDFNTDDFEFQFGSHGLHQNKRKGE